MAMRAQPFAAVPLDALLRDESRAAPYGTTFVVVAARLALGASVLSGCGDVHTDPHRAADIAGSVNRSTAASPRNASWETTRSVR